MRAEVIGYLFLVFVDERHLAADSRCFITEKRMQTLAACLAECGCVCLYNSDSALAGRYGREEIHPFAVHIHHGIHRIAHVFRTSHKRRIAFNLGEGEQCVGVGNKEITVAAHKLHIVFAHLLSGHRACKPEEKRYQSNG